MNEDNKVRNKKMRKLYYWIYIIWLSLKWVPKINLGDKVIWLKDTYAQTYIIINGVCPESWKITDGIEDAFEVKRTECKKIKTLPNYINSFKSGYRFYMGYWYSIWVRIGIEPWMRKCKIW